MCDRTYVEPIHRNQFRFPKGERAMPLKSLLLATSASFALIATANAQILSGKVSSEAEGLMEGVLVSAKKDGATITTTVVSNAKGEFSFPAGRLEPGKYSIAIRAAGYTLA